MARNGSPQDFGDDRDDEVLFEPLDLDPMAFEEFDARQDAPSLPIIFLSAASGIAAGIARREFGGLVPRGDGGRRIQRSWQSLRVGASSRGHFRGGRCQADDRAVAPLFRDHANQPVGAQSGRNPRRH